MEKKKILIIEDEFDIAKVLALRLKNAGYEIMFAKDAVQGIEFVHKTNPDLVILDLMLPAGNGLAVLESMRKSTYHCFTPVVVLTGSKDEKIKQKAIEEGVDVFLEKPYEPNTLLESVKNLLSPNKG